MSLWVIVVQTVTRRRETGVINDNTHCTAASLVHVLQLRDTTESAYVKLITIMKKSSQRDANTARWL